MKPEIKQQKENEVYDRIIKGETSLAIVESSLIAGWSETFVRKCLTVAYKRLAEKVNRDMTIAIATHIRRYEDIYEKSMGKARRAKHFLVANYSYLDAIEALFRKERVLGLHLKRTNIQVNNTKNKLVVDPMFDKYDFSQLTLEEKIEIRQLIAKTKEDYIPPVKLIEPIQEAVIIKEENTSNEQDKKAEVLKKYGLIK